MTLQISDQKNYLQEVNNIMTTLEEFKVLWNEADSKEKGSIKRYLTQITKKKLITLDQFWLLWQEQLICAQFFLET